MAGSGPAADPFSRKSLSGRNGSWVVLPAEGFQGAVPEWPLSTDPSGYELELWSSVWRSPQAVMWADGGMERVVARYVMVSALVEVEPTASMMGELRQMEDRLGLSPMALKKLQWIVEEPHKRGELAEVTHIERYADL